MTRLAITEADLPAAIDQIMGDAVRIEIRRLREGNDYAEDFPTPPIPPSEPLAGRGAVIVKPQDHPDHEQPPPRRRRRLSFREAAKQAGRPVASVTEHADGSRTLAFGETVEAADGDRTSGESSTNPWDIVYAPDKKRSS